jgi:hypothetical protein
MASSGRMSQLKAMLHDDDELRKDVVEMVTALEGIDSEDIRGFRRATLLDPSAPTFITTSKAVSSQIEEEPYQLLCSLLRTSGDLEPVSLPRKALYLDEISIGGVSYATKGSRKFRDSAVMFRKPRGHEGHTYDGKPGVIMRIFQYKYYATYEVTQYFLLIQEYVPIENPALDVYRSFGFAGGFLCKANLAGYTMVPLTHIVSHVVLTAIDDNLIHILPIDRVCSIPIPALSIKTHYASVAHVIVQIGRHFDCDRGAGKYHHGR